MAPKFGTSGLRGLVTELTDPLCAGYTKTFLEATRTDGTVLIGRDLRASSPRIAAAVAGGALAAGLRPLDCGVLPTPALALAATGRGTAAVMVTGSHIPDDRNGLKFYTAQGEITKEDEAAILSGYAPLDRVPAAEPEYFAGALKDFAARYIDYFGPEALAGLRLGLYEHSSAAREVLAGILTALGAEVIALGRADRFIPVDTEAIDADTRTRLQGWISLHGLDAILSTDGDGDRPMLADADGRVIPGDRLGPLTARALGARVVVTPVSANTLVDEMGLFKVVRTRIGSPYVIAGMEAAGDARVVGYEPNGGFLLGFVAERDGRRLPPLPTRDSVLPMIAPLAEARRAGVTLKALSDALPPRFTATDRLTEVPTDISAAIVSGMRGDPALARRLLGDAPVSVDETDGYRATMADGTILHIRPSGNAPELRFYAEAAHDPAAAEALRGGLERLSREVAARR